MPSEGEDKLPFELNEKVLCFHMDMLYDAKIIDLGPPEDDDNGEIHYKVHYRGWKNTWDDWVAADRMRKMTDENRQLAQTLMNQAKEMQRQATASAKASKKNAAAAAAKAMAAGTEKSGGGSSMAHGGGSGVGTPMSGAAPVDSVRGSEERGAIFAAAAAPGRGPRRTREFDLESEESFHNRPTIKLPISDLLKGLLVDDWENITNKNQLVPIPSAKPANAIFDDYLDHERKRREEGSAEMDILEETIDGMRQYFNKALGHILLYRFERLQWHDILRQIRSSDENSAIRCAADAYGAEHLARLLCSLEELIAHTNMDQQSVNRLRQELAVFIAWFTANFTTYFASNYETPSQEYIERARSC